MYNILYNPYLVKFYLRPRYFIFLCNLSPHRMLQVSHRLSAVNEVVLHRLVGCYLSEMSQLSIDMPDDAFIVNKEQPQNNK